MASYPDSHRVTEMELCIDTLTSDLIEYRYKTGKPRVFALVDGEYRERVSEGQEGQPTWISHSSGDHATSRDTTDAAARPA